MHDSTTENYSESNFNSNSEIDFIFPTHFTHKDSEGLLHQFGVYAREIEQPEHTFQPDNFTFEVWDDQGKITAKTVGKIQMRNGEKHYFEHRTANLGTDLDPNGHPLAKAKYPGLMQAAIANLLLSGTVDYWYSDEQLSQGARTMYDRLVENYRDKIVLTASSAEHPYVLRKIINKT